MPDEKDNLQPAAIGGKQTGDKPPSPFFPADNPAVTAHMNQLQGVINRLATQGSSCKTWCLTIVGALQILSGSAKPLGLVILTLILVLACAWIDTGYLATEKAYRKLWERMISLIHAGTYQLADTFVLDFDRKDRDRLKTLKSFAIWPFYGALAVACVVARLML